MLLWTSPELLRKHPKLWPIYGTKPADVYSYGIILHEILHRDVPYGNLLKNLGAECVFDINDFKYLLSKMIIFIN